MIKIIAILFFSQPKHAFKIIVDSTILKNFEEKDQYNLICLSLMNKTVYGDVLLYC